MNNYKKIKYRNEFSTGYSYENSLLENISAFIIKSKMNYWNMNFLDSMTMLEEIVIKQVWTLEWVSESVYHIFGIWFLIFSIFELHAHQF